MTTTPFRTESLPGGITQALVDDPHQMIRDALAQLVDVEGKTLRSITDWLSEPFERARRRLRESRGEIRRPAYLHTFSDALTGTQGR